MKASLKFKLPADVEEFRVASKATELYLCLWGMDQYLRNKIKFGGDLSNEEVETHELIREKLHNVLKDNDCYLGMMS